MSTKITYFVHGTTTDNEQDLATGWLPGELSGKGIEQAIAEDWRKTGAWQPGWEYEVA